VTIDSLPATEAAPWGGLLPWGRRLLLVDSITEAVGQPSGAVVVSGSHGGLSAARFALQAKAWLAVFNDAGIGKDSAGIAALPWLQHQGVAAVAVAHHSARIGEAASTWQDGVISAVNDDAAALGATPGALLRIWLQAAAAGISGSSAESSPGRR
jgi:hypothetical protein